MDLFDSIYRWNLWGSWKLPATVPREQTNTICRYIDTPEVIALIGPRRAGKSTILYQVMEHLLSKNIEDKALLHLNFEEPSLSPYLNVDLLDHLYQLYRSKLFPTGTAYVFLDEIQNIPGWEKWVRARSEHEDIKLFITGSSSALLSGELASSLSGRNFCFDIYPLSFKELLSFKQITIPEPPYPNTPPAEIEYALNQYLQWGGFPRIVLAKEDEERERLLRRYLDEILFKDIIERHQIRNVFALKNIAIHLLTNTSTLITYKRLAKIFEVSEDLARAYVGYLKDAFIINTLEFYSLKAAERIRNPMKVHAIDLGLRKIASISSSADESKLIETTIHQALIQQPSQTVFYWKGTHEVDLITQDGVNVTGLYQVTYEGLDREAVAKRELGGLEAGLNTFPKAKPYLITRHAAKQTVIENNNINVVPLWHFLLDQRV